MFPNLELRNDFCTLTFYSHSVRGVVQDYIISFHEKVEDIESVLEKTYEVFEQLMEKFSDKTLKARLIAQVHYHHMNEKNEVVGDVDYHFASYRQEYVTEPYLFFERHMSKIASRSDSFHEKGSSLLLSHIKHIYIAITVFS